MKKTLMFVCMLAVSLIAEKIAITEACQIRDGERWRESKKIGVAMEGTMHDVLDTFGDWYEVEVIEGSDHVGKKGYMWEARIDRANGNILVEGLTLRKTPERPRDNTPADTGDDVNFIAKVKAGAKVKIIRVIPTWYKIAAGWVSARCAKSVK